MNKIEKKSIECPFCKGGEVFNSESFKSMETHIKEHREIDWKIRRSFIEGLKHEKKSITEKKDKELNPKHLKAKSDALANKKEKIITLLRQLNYEENYIEEIRRIFDHHTLVNYLTKNFSRQLQLFEVAGIFFKTKKAEKRAKKKSKKKRDMGLTVHRNHVLKALREIGVEDHHIANIQKAGDETAINSYLYNVLGRYHAEFDNKQIWYKPGAKRPKRRKTKLERPHIILTPMGNKR